MKLSTKDKRWGFSRGKKHIKLQLGPLRIYFSLSPLKPKHESIKRRSFRRRQLERQPVCQFCGKPLTMETLSIHHIKPISERPDLVYEPDNCISLCKRCHVEHHRGLNRIADTNRIPVLSTAGLRPAAI